MYKPEPCEGTSTAIFVQASFSVVLPRTVLAEFGCSSARARSITSLNGFCPVTADTALRLARFFGTDAQSWMNLQAQYDLESAEIELAGRIEREVTPFKAAA
jgi:addiction module HigA family antidote